MSESGSDREVIVTAQERAHPALRKLARACIALARQAVGEASPSEQPLLPATSAAATVDDSPTDAQEQSNG